jgi:hypothetical protein
MPETGDPRHPSSLKLRKIRLAIPTLPSPALPRVYAFSVEHVALGLLMVRMFRVAGCVMETCHNVASLRPTDSEVFTELFTCCYML